jgi:PIN domain nuclease of toxin-antitoxin system
MILLDTHAWIYYLGDPDALSAPAMNAISQSETIGLSIMSCMEAAILIRKGKIQIDQSLENWMEQMTNVYRLEILPITPSIVIRANSFSDFHPDPADRIIAATSIAHGIPLITKDRILTSRKDIQTIW